MKAVSKVDGNKSESETTIQIVLFSCLASENDLN